MSEISRIPLRYMFWAILYSFIINLLDETMMNGGFVEGMRAHFWSGFSADKFFFMNGLFISSSYSAYSSMNASAAHG